MLILSRKIREQILVIMPDGRLIEVEVMDRKGSGEVKIGVGAPPDVKIYRREIAPQDVLDRLEDRR